MSGNTDFEKPMNLVKDLVQRYIKDFHGFHICFLSDGIAPMPNDAINAIKEEKEVLDKFNITTVAFGDDKKAEKVLKPLAETFGHRGGYKKALKP